MSTELTNKGNPMVDSVSLRLVHATARTRESISAYLAGSLIEGGYAAVTPATLNFLSALDCGVNYGSDIARHLDVSRQMVARTVRELCDLGYLEQGAGPGRQKPITFTDLGERLIADARELLAELDEKLAAELGRHVLNDALARLDQIDACVVRIARPANRPDQ